MKRRVMLLGGSLLTGMVLSGGAAATFRWHAHPRRNPHLSDPHLRRLYDLPTGPETRVLFVGNSMTLRHDLPVKVAAKAAQAGIALQIGSAAARGARLVETWRIDAFRAVLERGWDVLVLQDFSTTCLRAPDRWGSAYAMRQMARAARAQAVILYPTWAFPSAHRVYEQGAGPLSRPPADPDAFAACIIAHYDAAAQTEGWVRAPVTEALHSDTALWLEDDLHHPSPVGTERIAEVLWQSLRPLLSG